jgi:hypothetical protein
MVVVAMIARNRPVDDRKGAQHSQLACVENGSAVHPGPWVGFAPNDGSAFALQRNARTLLDQQAPAAARCRGRLLRMGPAERLPGCRGTPRMSGSSWNFDGDLPVDVHTVTGSRVSWWLLSFSAARLE